MSGDNFDHEVKFLSTLTARQMDWKEGELEGQQGGLGGKPKV